MLRAATALFVSAVLVMASAIVVTIGMVVVAYNSSPTTGWSTVDGAARDLIMTTAMARGMLVLLAAAAVTVILLGVGLALQAAGSRPQPVASRNVTPLLPQTGWPGEWQVAAAQRSA